MRKIHPRLRAQRFSRLKRQILRFDLALIVDRRHLDRIFGDHHGIGSFDHGLGKGHLDPAGIWSANFRVVHT